MILLFFEDKSKGQEIVDISNKIQADLSEMLVKKNFFTSTYRWMTNDCLGSIDQVKTAAFNS